MAVVAVFAVLVLVVVVASSGSGGGRALRSPAPVDPEEVFDPVEAGERLPARFRQLVPRDHILPVYDPVFVPAGESPWGDEDLVIGVAIDGDARAYPVGFLDRREMVVDTVGGVPVLVSWCPLCGTAMVHDRTVGERVLVFGNQGALFGNAMTWWDHDTGSVWSQPLGEAILGPRSGQTVELIPSVTTSWGAWRSAHPTTLALDAPAGSASAELDDLVIVVDLGRSAVAYPVAALRSVGVANDIVASRPVAVVLDPAGSDRWSVFSREVDGGEVVLAVDGGRLVDTRTRSVFDAVTGVGLEGPLQGAVLDRLPASTSFPADVPTFWPGARTWPPSIVID
ncbi:MAG: DUF3179 domain-containing (seleno)protein [Acidimicrobiia bacterium]|nr:DUF3179 domain-containing (seleno)protein [Acidimicrobiia bacterium]